MAGKTHHIDDLDAVSRALVRARWIAVAVIVVFLNRDKMFNREDGVTNIIEESTPSEQPNKAYSLA